MRIAYLFAAFCLLSCQDAPLAGEAKSSPGSATAEILASLTDPAKLDALKGKRAATPRLRKSCYWIEAARREGQDPVKLIESAQRINGSYGNGASKNARGVPDAEPDHPGASGMPG